MQPRAPRRQRRDRALVASQRPGQRQSQKQQHATSHRQQQPLLKAQAPPIATQRAQEKFHRRPIHRLEATPIKDVNHNRQRREQKPRSEKRRIHKSRGENVQYGKHKNQSNSSAEAPSSAEKDEKYNTIS